MELHKAFKFLLASFVVAAVLGCGGGADVVAPKAENPNPDLQPAGRGVDAGAPATGGEVGAP